MAATQDYTKMMKDFMGNFPGMDMSAMQDAYKSYAAFGEKMSKVALEAADKSTEISTKWTKDTLSKMGDVTTQAPPIPSSTAPVTKVPRESSRVAVPVVVSTRQKASVVLKKNHSSPPADTCLDIRPAGSNRPITSS